MAASIRFREGTSFTQQFTIYDVETRQAIPLAGATITFAVYPVPSGSAYLTLGIGTGITVTDAANGVIQVKFTPAMTPGGAGSYTWELRIDLPGGDVYNPDGGKFILLSGNLT